jgi:hypothetical protein
MSVLVRRHGVLPCSRWAGYRVGRRFAVLLTITVAGGCSLFDSSEGYTLSSVNGQPLPATVESDPQLRAIVLQGRLELLPRQTFRISYLWRFIEYDGARVERDTTRAWEYRGAYLWTDSALRLMTGRISSTFRVIEGGRALQGLEDIPFFMGVEFVRNP